MGVYTAAAMGLSALGSFIGAGRSAQTATRNTEQTIEANKEMQEYAFSQNKQMQEMAFQRNRQMAMEEWRRNKYMWELQKEYNSPAAQMARFKEAGLNPHLIYGQGTPGNVQSYPTYDAPRYNAPSYQAPRVDYNYKPDQSIPAALEALSNVMDYASKEEKIKQQKVKTWLEQNTKFYKMSQESSQAHKLGQEAWSAELDRSIKKIRMKIEKIKSTFWEKGISPSDSTWLRLGISALEYLGVDNDVLNELLKSIPEKAKSQILKSN